MRYNNLKFLAKGFKPKNRGYKPQFKDSLKDIYEYYDEEGKRHTIRAWSYSDAQSLLANM